MSSLRVALLAYRGNPHSGGQGVYVRHLSRGLARLGHQVEVLSGQPYPELDPGVTLTRLESLDLYRPEHPFRRARKLRDLVDLLEFGTMCVGGFPEPLTFSLRAWRHLTGRAGDFDVVHDNQSLGYGLLGIEHLPLPVLATVHHPIAIDRRLELAAAPGWQRRIAIRRWYGFVRMQRRVAPRLRRLLTVSDAARDEIVRELGVPSERIAVVSNGVDASTFRPRPEQAKVEGRVVATASADVPLKGLVPLLEAVALVRNERRVELVVVGKARRHGAVAAAIDRLGLRHSVRFLNGIGEGDLVDLYAQAELAVVPSLYEGFSLPAVEAMACAVPLVATTAGALPEVVGRDGEAGFLVPPGDAQALAAAINRALSDAALRRRLGEAGRARVLEMFTWERAAQATVAEYEKAIAAC
ncbi:MAG TPA: glycosyltransferase family 4 protein [Candidatus Dormibacteraeota bacterium]